MGASQNVPFVTIYPQISSIFAASASREAAQEDAEFVGTGEEREPLTLEPPASSESRILTQLTTLAVKAALMTQRQYFRHTQIFYVKIAINHA